MKTENSFKLHFLDGSVKNSDVFKTEFSEQLKVYESYKQDRKSTRLHALKRNKQGSHLSWHAKNTRYKVYVIEAGSKPLVSKCKKTVFYTLPYTNVSNL